LILIYKLFFQVIGTDIFKSLVLSSSAHTDTDLTRCLTCLLTFINLKETQKHLFFPSFKSKTPYHFLQKQNPCFFSAEVLVHFLESLISGVLGIVQ